MSSDPTIRLRRGPSAPDEGGRSLAAAAALAGALAAGVTLVICVSLALTGWFLADAGAHGDTTDALRAGADGWLVGHGSRLDLAGLHLGMMPLALTLMMLVGTSRAGRWAAGRAGEVEDDRVLGTAVAAFVGCYLVIAVVVCIVATQDGATPGLGRTVLGALLVATAGGGLGLAAGTGRLEEWIDLVPLWARELAVGAIVSALSLLAAGAVLVAVSLLFSLNEAATIYSSLGMSTGDALTFTFLMALTAPNAALLGSSYLLGPGFAFGAGTTVSPTAVGLGAVPAFPILAALPSDGPTPGWLVGLLVVPAVCAGIGTVVSHRYGEPLAFDLAALRGAGAGLAGGVLITLAIALAGGPLGTGRLSEIGAPIAEVLMFATGIMSAGGLVGGLAQAWWQRRHAVAD
jgi:hypothetical protein